ncbi:cation/multidrug efflux pump [Clostridium aceticum]|uniref:Cation/multidrug efflux pump n=1 Tax=Clostridium aceticum TaxID=84022 RepID=A0A0D8IDZ3_9CLOT|nr:efflux RND transporter permease subunit [Clostridium aceticum]AKL94100.1 cation/multidrug efflux pump [Clostridium aceticum]KJF28540.1 hypothetical protein TZ02_01070 [Clostridium aceticum]
MEDKKNSSIPELLQKRNFLGRWAAFFINRHRVTYLLIIIIFFWGITQYSGLQREAQPKVTIPFAIVQTTYVGASPEEVEALVTDPIEKKLEELTDVRRMTSESIFGQSTIFVEFDSGSDIQEKIRETREKILDISDTLPAEVETPKVMDMKTGESPVLVFTLGGNQDILEIQGSAKKIKDLIESVEGVTEVALIGDIKREINVIVDPQKLSVYAISLQDIKNALIQSNVNLPGGDIKLNEIHYNVRTIGRFEKVEELNHVIIRDEGNGKVYLKDIAVIEDGYEDIKKFVRKSVESGENPSIENVIAISVHKKESADDITVRNNILEKLQDHQEDLYPDDMKLEIVSDKADYVERQLGSVTDNAKSGLLLVIVVLFLFIGFKEALIVAFVIPLSIFAAFGLMKVWGLTLNEITMFSLVLAVGMLVDNAIVVMENIDRLRSKGLSSKLAAEAGTNQVAPAIMASTLTTLAAFFPLALTPGISGDYIRPMPLTVIFALSASFFMAVTISPSICAGMIKNHRSQERKLENPQKQKYMKMISVVFVFILSMIAFKDWGQEGIKQYGILSIIMAVLFAFVMFLKQFKFKGSHEDSAVLHYYQKCLGWIVTSTKRKWLLIVLIFLLFISSVALIPLGILKVEMFGDEDMPGFYVEVNTPQGSNLEDTLEIIKQVETYLFTINEIKHFVSYVGDEGTDMWSLYRVENPDVPNKGRIIVELQEEMDRERSSVEIANQIRNQAKKIPGAEIKVVELAMGAPTGSPIHLRVKGENLEDLEKTAKSFAEILKAMEGTRDVVTSIGEGVPELQVRVDKVRASMLGLDNMSIALSMRNVIHGIEATTFRENQEEIDVMIRTSKDRLRTVHDIEKIFFYTSRGEAIPFLQVAEVVETESIMNIAHEDSKRRIAVLGEIDDERVTAVEIINRFKEEIKDYAIPEGVVLEFGGEMEEMEESFENMMNNMILAAILVYIILAIQFNSLTQPLIILFAVPMALIGVMPGLVITGNKFGFVAFVAVVALVGIAVNDAIVLVDYINYLRSNGDNLKDAILETGKTRFLPVLATTITTAGGILPITLKEAFYAPLGIALICGLCMSTLLTLVIVPTMYSILEEHKLKRLNKKEKELHNSI